MANMFDDLTAAIARLESSVKKDLDEIRKEKNEVLQFKENIYQNNPGSKYIREDHCLILSAPKIIIGDVDHNGNLNGYASGSQVIIRGNNICNEASGAVGVGGTITNRATSIRNIAVDPGCDGYENAVFPRSEIVNQARSITLQSNDETDAFSTSPVSGTAGINILSDTNVSVHALAPNKGRTNNIDSQITVLQNISKDCASKAGNYKIKLDEAIKKMTKLVTDQDQFNADYDLASTNYQELYYDQHDEFLRLERIIYSLVASYISVLAQEAEAERSITALKATKDKLSKNSSNFDKASTGASLSIRSESISVVSSDGDGGIRENPEAGMQVVAPHVSFSATDKKSALVDDGSFAVNAKNINLSTANHNYTKDDHSTGDFPAEGNISVYSKTVTVQSIDRELKDQKLTEKALTKDGKLDIRFETVNISNTDTEGKSTGKIALNAKTMNIASMDVDKESRTDKEMAAGSKLTILAEKNYMGTTKATKLIQLASEKVGIMGKDTAEIQQDGKAVVTCSGGNLTAGGSKVELDGNTTIQGGADIKGETKTPKLSADGIEAKSAFKSPNINDTMGAGVPGSPGSPSAKMTEEEAKTTE